MNNLLSLFKSGTSFIVMILLVLISDNFLENHTLAIFFFSLMVLNIILQIIQIAKNKVVKYKLLTINKGKRRPCGQIQLPIYCTKKRRTKIKDFTFCNNVRYKFEDEDQHDKNKLFGFSFGFTDGPLNFIKNDTSFRFGWNCDNDEPDTVSIYTYTRFENKMTIDFLYNVKLNKRYKYILDYEGDMITYAIKDFSTDETLVMKTYIVDGAFKSYGSTLGLYFGGNKKAPHDMDIIEHLK